MTEKGDNKTKHYHISFLCDSITAKWKLKKPEHSLLDISEYLIYTPNNNISGYQAKKEYANFHERCIPKIEKHMKCKLTHFGSTREHLYCDTSNTVRVVIYAANWNNTKKQYWFSPRPDQLSWLKAGNAGYCAFCCGSESNMLLIPIFKLEEYLSHCGKSSDGQWHIEFAPSANTQKSMEVKIQDNQKRVRKLRIDVTQYLI